MAKLSYRSSLVKRGFIQHPRRGAADGATEPPSTRIVSPAATIERSGPGVPKVPDNDGQKQCR
jgi:hypothetical protein